MKAWKLLSVPLMFMLLSGMPWSEICAADVTDTVTAEPGEHITIDGNVSVKDKDHAVHVTAQSENVEEGAEDKSASVTVNGDVSLANSATSSAICIEGGENKASANVSGNVSAKSEAYATGIELSSNANNGDVTASVTVGGDVSAESPEYATGINSVYGDIDVTGNITAKGGHCGGLMFYSNKNTATVGGNITSESDSDSTGAQIINDGTTKVDIKGGVFSKGESANGIVILDGMLGFTHSTPSAENTFSLTVGNGITATSTKPSEYDLRTSGLAIYDNGLEKLTADITGDVVAKSPDNNAVGIQALMTRGIGYNSASDEQPSDILVHGNVISDGVGIEVTTFGSNAKINTLVEGTVNAKDVGVLLQGEADFPTYSTGYYENNPVATTGSTPNLNLTVWKIVPNENGNVVERQFIPWRQGYGYDHYGATDSEQPVREAATDFEKKIMYIIKIEQPGEGGTLSVVDANGKALSKSFDFDVAKEGDKILLKANLKEGYKLVAAYNGEGEKQPLLKDNNGNYYIVVPKGGGVYLTVELENTTEHSYAEPDNGSNVIYQDDTANNKNDSGTSSTANLSYQGSVASDSATVGPKTGDTDMATPWLLLSVVSIGGILGLEACNKKNSLKKVNED